MLTEKAIEALLADWQKSRRLKAREVLLDSGQVAKELYFISSGCVRMLVIDQEGQENNIGFGYQHSLITSFQSFIESQPSQLVIEAINDTEVASINKTALSKLLDGYPEISRWYQSLLEKTLAGHIQRQIELLTYSPRERYEIFLQRSGHLINNIPLKHIASYLMMTPETLSRIRAAIS